MRILLEVKPQARHMNEVKTETFYNRSLERALHILNCFTNDRQALSIAQLADIINLPRATVLRLCTTLVRYGYLMQDLDSRRYSLGLKLFELGNIVFYSFSLRNVAAPYLSQLQMKLGKTVFLGILENDELLYLDKREDPGNPISFTSKVGTRRAPYWGMLGPILMAYLPESEIERILGKYPLTAITRKSLTNREEFKECLRRIRDRGFFVEVDTAIEGTSGIGAPVFDSSGKIAASMGCGFISSSVVSKESKVIIREVVDTAGKISKDLGYRSPVI
jgi:IclR family KDG regulon transcriptional repressor